jgi:signal transduction histidine kinase
MVAGVAGGLSLRLHIDVTIVRVVLVLIALSGFGVAIYVLAWLLVPLEGDPVSIAARAAEDRRGIALAVASLPLLAIVLFVSSVVGIGYLSSAAWPLVLSGAGLILIYRNADESEQARLRHAVEPFVQLRSGPGRPRRLFAARVALGTALLLFGLWLVAVSRERAATLRPLEGAFIMLAAIVVLFGPWWLKLARDLVSERQARVRAEERADMAARVHDSVLQTLALIQRSANQPQQVAQLARAQERELRSWLFAGGSPGSVEGGPQTLAAGVARIESEVEAAHDVTVDAVTVGDLPLTDDLRALLAAGREATLNAAKWSGASSVQLYVEVEPRRVSMYVRDRGTGFDPAAVPADRGGIAESIVGRMARHGGTATIRSEPGEGTEVELVLPVARA